jgi:Ca2+-binding EF-hand superfamily protein
VDVEIGGLLYTVDKATGLVLDPEDDFAEVGIWDWESEQVAFHMIPSSAPADVLVAPMEAATGPAANVQIDKPHQRSPKPTGDAWVAVQPAVISALELPNSQTRADLFRRADADGKGALSPAEIDWCVVALYPEFNHKPALMRAYMAADSTGDGFINQQEFTRLLHFLSYFINLWQFFEQIDPDGDKRLDAGEFMSGCSVVGVEGSAAELTEEFGRLDVNGDGYVLFDDFCTWCARRDYGESSEEEDHAPRNTLPVTMEPSEESLHTSKAESYLPPSELEQLYSIFQQQLHSAPAAVDTAELLGLGGEEQDRSEGAQPQGASPPAHYRQLWSSSHGEIKTPRRGQDLPWDAAAGSVGKASRRHLSKLSQPMERRVVRHHHVLSLSICK